MRYQKEKGFTLIETLMVIGVFIFAIGTVSSFIIYAYKGTDLTFKKAMAITNVKNSATQISKELREAIQSDQGSYLLESCDDFEIIFYSNIDADDQVEKIRYFLENQKLKKEIIKTENTEEIIISSYVINTSTPVFYYYNQTNTELETPISVDNLDEVSLVGIKIIINADSEDSPDFFHTESKARLRNVN